MQKSKAILALFYFCVLIVGVRILTIPATDGRGRNFSRGDGYSDTHILYSVNYFVSNGFWGTWFRPMQYKIVDGEKHDDIYTHYPALPNVLAAGWAKLIGSTHESALRILPGLTSIALFILLFNFFSSVFRETPHLPIVAMTMLYLGNYFLAWSDSLHEHTYAMASLWLALILNYRHHFTEKIPCFDLFSVLFGVIVINIGFDAVFATFAIFFGFQFLKVKQNKLNLIYGPALYFGVGLLAGFAGHVYLNALYYGSLGLALEDLSQAFSYRSGGNTTATSITLKDRLLVHWDTIARWDRYFTIGGLGVITTAYLALKELKNKKSEFFGIGIILFISGLTWPLLMTQHASVHHFTARHYGPFVGVICSYGLIVFWNQLKLHYKQRSYLLIIYGGLMLTMSFNFIYKHIIDIWWRFGLSRLFF